MDWLWQGLITSALWALVALVGGLILGWLKAQESVYVIPALYALGGFALILFIIVQARSLYYGSTAKQQAATPSDSSRQLPASSQATLSMEQSVRTWLDTTGYAIERRPPREDMSFLLTVSLRDFKFDVHDLKSEKGLIFIACMFTYKVPPGKQIDAARRARIFRKVAIELLRKGIQYEAPEWGKLLLVEAVPFDASLTSAEFRRRIMFVQTAVKLVSAVLESEFSA